MRNGRIFIRGTISAALAGVLTITVWCLPVKSQEKYDSTQRDKVRDMLRDVAKAMRKNYYDPSFHGVDMEARYKTAEERILKAEHLAQGFAAIFAALDPLNDSHTFFVPPTRPVRFDYGYQMQMVGDRCFVTAIRPKSDASEKLKLGDEVLEIEGYRPTRGTLGKMEQYYHQFSPRLAMHFKVRSAEGQERAAEVTAKVQERKLVTDLTNDHDFRQYILELQTMGNLLRERYVEFSDAFMIWKMPQFNLSDDGVDHMFGLARKHQTLILDLRGNPGGHVKTLETVVGEAFDHDVVIAKRVGRKPDLKPLEAKSRGSHAFTGKLIVLIDSRSASAAELFARVVQLEKRGTVIGDLSSGSVMESQLYPMQQGLDSKILYGASITDADLVMTDGKSLEHNGVTPDETILPTAADLAAGRDPVLVRAAELAGVKLEPAQAGKMFPVEWMPE